MVTTHGSNVLGSVQDIAGIGEVLHDHGVYFIIDGAQTAGHIPIDLQALRSTPTPSPATRAFRHRRDRRVLPAGSGVDRPTATGTGTDSISLFQPRDMPERFEAGTHNYPGLAALAAGVNYIQSTGLATIAEKAERQTAFLIGELKSEPNITIHNPHPALPIISFNIQGMENDDVGYTRPCMDHRHTGLHCLLSHRVIDGGMGLALSLSGFDR